MTDSSSSRSSPRMSRCFSSSMSGLPDGVRSRQDGLELAPLQILLQGRLAIAAEAALRAERQLLQRQMAARLLDLAPQRLHRLDVGALGGDETEDGDRAGPDIAQRRETAGAVAVIFEQQPLVLQLGEEPLGDSVVMALAVPLRRELAGRRIDGAGTAAADMQPEGDRIEPFDHGIVGGDRAREAALRILAAGPHGGERGLVDIGGVARRVDLDVAAAGGDQLLDHLALDSDDMVEKIVEVAIGRARRLGIEALGDAVGAE